MGAPRASSRTESSAAEGRLASARRREAAAVAQAAEAAVLAVPWHAVDDTLAALHDHVDGKVIIDITNPYVDGRLHLLADWSSAEHIQDHAPSTRVVKAWNCVYASIVNSTPEVGGVAATVFVCGNDRAAKASVIALAATMGYDPVDAGALSSARYLEPLAGLMGTLAYEVGMGTDQALKLMRR
jgi:predicted dinucleotide-binding enzyme